jgi:type I restriction enzyme R subunit
MAIHNESEFERELCKALSDSKWLHSKNDDGYDSELNLFPNDIFDWLEETQPKEFSKLFHENLHPEKRLEAKNQLIRRLAQTLDLPLENGGGTLNVLRRGFKDGSNKFVMCQFKPSDNLNPETIAKYKAVKMRVMQQVHYSTKNRNSIDLVFFVNGIPVATAELKTDFTQNIQDAIDQYRTDRNPKGEGLLAFGKRALVHFAISNSEVYTTTKLDGIDTKFLPFNKGNDGRAGNPAHPTSSKTAYMWEEVLQRDNFLQIIGRYMHLVTTIDEDPISGKKTKKESLLFPRFHQLEVVNSLVTTSKIEGAGKKYLIQHSAGSGKTNSIAWTAHQLSTLHTDDGVKVFDSVIVVTDRTVLDDQLQNAIRQIDAKNGVVAAIKSQGGSKSEQLVDALKAGTPIIVVTIQTFPFVLNQVETSGIANGKKFAIIADEAHSSQTGTTAAKLRTVLSDSELQDIEDGGDIDMETALLVEMQSRAVHENISFYAFTATPKAKTLELFGRPSATGLPAPFHTYTMQQAIEEGFILDVLQNYTPYKVAFKLAHGGIDYDSNDPLVEQDEALKSLMRWVRLHPTNISSKVSIIVEHFRQNIAHLLEGKAKAMVVTGSRKEAVRYKIAFDKYIVEKNYVDLKALVAFSGDVNDGDLSPEPFNENSMNDNLRGRSIPDAFKSDDFQILLVANKYQTGFDQPLLTAMYVDKTLSGVTAVQTLSRLNRTAPGKDFTYILDFVNKPEEILAAFLPYYRDAQLSDVTDPNIVHDIQTKLMHAGIYDANDVERVVTLFLQTEGRRGNNALSSAMAPSKDRFWGAFERAVSEKNNVEVDRLLDFRKTVESFIKAYGFLSQLYNYEDTELEKHFIFLKFLSREIRDSRRRSEIDLSGVSLNAFGIKKGSTINLQLTEDGGTIAPTVSSGGGVPVDPEMALLSQAVARLNDLFESDLISGSDTRAFVIWISEKASENATLKTQAKANSLDQFLASPDLQKTLIETVVSVTGNAKVMANDLLSDTEKIGLLTRLVGELLHTKLNAV